VEEICRSHHLDNPPQGAVHENLQIVRLVSGLSEMRSNPLYREDLPAAVRQSAQALALDERRLRVMVGELQEMSNKAAALFPKT
jgi:hypothetical protein